MKTPRMTEPGCRSGLGRTLLPAAAIALVVLLGVLAGAQAGRSKPPAQSADQALLEAVAEMRRTMGPRASREQLSQVVGRYFDFDELARRSLGPAWDRQSRSDRARFTRLLRAVIEANYLPSLRKAAPDFVLDIRRSEHQDQVVKIYTVASSKDNRLPLDFRLVSRQGRWRIFDTVIDGVGLVQTYQDQFSRVLARQGMPGLLDALERKKAALDKQAEPD